MTTTSTSKRSTSIGCSKFVALLGVVASLLCPVSVLGLAENDRLREYHKRGYTWPPPAYIPDTPGWRDIYDRRFEQVQQIPLGGAGRYDGWLETVTSALIVQNFTETGWGLTRVPEDLIDALRDGIHDGLAKKKRLEHKVDVIDGPTPWFISRPDLTERVLDEVQPILEAWSGVELTPQQAYGFRLYRNQSRLFMHIDRTQTHVISCILHVDSSEDAEPWPIVIEDYQGNTNEVILQSGDMLLYESSKCFHGRPYRFNGSWYTSVFVHFYPADEGWQSVDYELEGHYGVPPHWNAKEKEYNVFEKLEMLGTSMKEPECPDMWCGLKESIHWEGPGEEGYVLTSEDHRYSLYEEDDLAEL